MGYSWFVFDIGRRVVYIIILYIIVRYFLVGLVYVGHDARSYTVFCVYLDPFGLRWPVANISKVNL
jgi:hypothetical protein